MVARELTLLPRHWEWLGAQPGGASVAVRKLVEEARHTHQDQDRLREARESAYRFIFAVAGDFPGFEEATRALFAANEAEFNRIVGFWPADVRRHAKRLADTAFDLNRIAQSQNGIVIVSLRAATPGGAQSFGINTGRTSRKTKRLIHATCAWVRVLLDDNTRDNCQQRQTGDYPRQTKAEICPSVRVRIDEQKPRRAEHKCRFQSDEGEFGSVSGRVSFCVA